MTPYVALYTRTIQILGVAQVTAYSVDQAIEKGRNLVRDRRVPFRFGNTKFGNVLVDDKTLNFFVLNTDGDFYQVSMTASVTASATATVIADSRENAIEELKKEDITFRYNKIPIPDITSADSDGFALTETVRPIPEFYIDSAVSSSEVGVVISVQIGSPVGVIEIYRNNKYIDQYVASVEGIQSIQLGEVETGNNYYQFRFVGNEEYSDKTIGHNIVGIGFPSTVQLENDIEVQQSVGNTITLEITVDNASSYVPTGTVSFSYGGFTQISGPLVPHPGTGNPGRSRVFMDVLVPNIIGAFSNTELKYSGDQFLSESSGFGPSLTVSHIQMIISTSAAFSPNPIPSGSIFRCVGMVRTINEEEGPEYGMITIKNGNQEWSGYSTQGPSSSTLLYSVDIGPLEAGEYELEMDFISPNPRFSDGFNYLNFEVGGTIPTGEVPVYMSSTPVPAIGGTLTVTGTGFAPDVRVRVDGVEYPVTGYWYDSISVQIPPLDSGSYSIEIFQGSGSSGVIPNAVVVEPDGFNPAVLELTSWFKYDNFVEATYPAAVSWQGKPSAGPSGDRRIIRNTLPQATLNPTMDEADGIPAVFFEAVDASNHSSHFIIDSSSNIIKQTDITSGTLGGAISMVLSHEAGANNGATDSVYMNPGLLHYQYVNYGWSIVMTTSGVRFLGTNNTAPYYWQTASAGGSPNTLMLVQAKIDEVNRTIYVRVGKGPWQSRTLPADGFQISKFNCNVQLGGVTYQPLPWGQVARPKYVEIMTFSGFDNADDALNDIADLAASEYGITV